MFNSEHFVNVFLKAVAERKILVEVIKGEIANVGQFGKNKPHGSKSDTLLDDATLVGSS